MCNENKCEAGCAMKILKISRYSSKFLIFFLLGFVSIEKLKISSVIENLEIRCNSDSDVAVKGIKHSHPTPATSQQTLSPANNPIIFIT